MSPRVDFYFDVGSPASYLAWTQLPALARERDAELVWKPILLGGVFQATGNASPVTVPAKGRYMTRDLQRCAAGFGVPWSMNPHFPINTLFLMRVVTGTSLREPERLDALLAAVFQALWVDGVDLNRPELVASTLQAAGFDPQRLLALAGETEVKDRLRATTEEAVARGVFGAPTMFVGEEMYFGQDRLDMVREALREAKRPANG